MDARSYRPMSYQPVPHPSSPALAHALSAQRSGARSLPAARLPHYILFAVALVAFLVSAGLLVAPQVASLAHYLTRLPARSQSSTGASATVISPAQLQTVLSYAQQMRPDDSLVQVRNGVFAKRSNVDGVDVDGRTVYYDLAPHQSFGPLRTGRVDESQVNVLARQNAGDTQILVYTLR